MAKHEATLKLLDKNHVDALLIHEQVLEAVCEAFILHSLDEGRGFSVVRESLGKGGIFGIKSAEISSQGLLGFKAAGFWPRNRSFGGEPHQATIMLMDPATGRPLCLIDGNSVTTLRTGAAGALGLQLLACPHSSSACVFGSGVQAGIQLDYALRVMPKLRHVLYVTANGLPDLRFEGRFLSRCVLQHSVDANSAVAQSNIVITATPGAGALFDLDAVRPGTHFNCVGADTRGKRELPEGLLKRACVVVDDHGQASTLGETQWAPEVPILELGDLLTGKAKFNRALVDISVFDMTGLALQDLTVARLLHQRACADNMGHDISWPW
ncbi:ornithine cyclodeaminase family protein [Pseudomonas sp. Fl5BN2]|uniref:ornithine cyclodeaminase family protein n=1 Tax=unclassified Pseudomonas TaxID=196821 RepID=UPI0013771DE9|nr:MULTISPECIES: ornithine cyclodeaminase family protein [unclassified Pseudomonas]NBF05053.1 ornithine cyclodeaminase family protein [Pseudomonas sp. Fl5BN2]NBF08735.1 ornithine cyclodeaminase family protein [Pseudomonas sp. Fl4BN1]